MKYSELIPRFTKNFFRQFEEPIWQTKSKEAAIRIAKELGPLYYMSVGPQGLCFSFHLRMLKEHVDEYNKVVEELKAESYSPLLRMFDEVNETHLDKRTICKTIEKVVEDIEAEKRQAIVDRIEVEEETRSKYRRY